MSALRDCVLSQRKTTSLEGRHCIFSKHPVSEHLPRNNLNNQQVIVGGYGDKEVKKQLTEKSHYGIV
jgi:hypothetical protein